MQYRSGDVVAPATILYRIITLDWVDSGVILPISYTRIKRPKKVLGAKLEDSLSFFAYQKPPDLGQVSRSMGISKKALFGYHVFPASALTGIVWESITPITLNHKPTGRNNEHVEGTGFPNPITNPTDADTLAETVLAALSPTLVTF